MQILTERSDVRAWSDIAALGLTQIIGYGTLYYSFGILAPAMARDLGWPEEWVFGALSIALLTGGLIAPWSGRWIDRFGAGRVMTAGSVTAVLALTVCAAAPSGFTFLPALIAIEIASTMVQYGAAFPLLVQRHPRTAQRSIVWLTLIAGFASTLFWPFTSWLHGFMSWREVYIVFAALNLMLCVPLHAWLSRPAAADPKTLRAGQPASDPPESPQGSVAPANRRTAFILMAAAFAFQSFVSSAVLVHMLPMLGSLGLGVIGVTVGALFGPSQVASRLINMIFGRNLSQLILAAVAAALLPGALVLLTLTAPSIAGAMAFAVLFGMGNGLYSIVGGTLPLALFGADGYGRRQGQIMSVRLIVGSVAPFAFALIMHQLGIHTALGMSAGLGFCAVAALAMVAVLLRRTAMPASTASAVP
ncbi:arsenite efflux MFS transporter ArsK [uncultured Tistrella sp.]|uniref:arsenite efflux MFS transporter ArsK n=1 Tax=Tistrella mobilis TaxID=171437 RepID=UPI00260E2709|nr:arsenite efflux MFS transporter ArsK [uncultured Tistrella sp.]